MNTKKNYVAPATETVELKAATFFAASGDFGANAYIIGRGDLEDDYED